MNFERRRRSPLAASPGGKGLGLFCGLTAGLSRSAFVCEYAGEVIGAREAEARAARARGASRSSPAANYILHVNETYAGGRRGEQVIIDPVRACLLIYYSVFESFEDIAA